MAKAGKKRTAEKLEQSEIAISRAMAAFKLSGRLMPAFLAEYEKFENQTSAGQSVGVSHDTVAKWKKNPDFISLFTAAHIRAQRKHNDNLRASMIQRAINGSPEILTYQGKVMRDEKGNPIVQKRIFETQLTMFMAKNRMPDEFRDKFEYEVNGQIIVTLASEFLAIVRRLAPPEVSNSIQKELETLSAKMTHT